MSVIIKIPRDAIKAILLFAAVHDIRYYLNGLLVEATSEATRIIGTDGRMLGIHHSEQANTVEQPTSLIVPRQALAYIRPLVARTKWDKKGRPLLSEIQLERDDSGWLIRDHVSGLRFGFDPIEGKFPDYVKVLPKETTDVAGSFNPSYIGRLGLVAKAFRREAYNVSFSHNGDNAGLVSISGVPGFIAVVMPQRNNEKAQVPGWAKASLLTVSEPKPEPVPA